MTLPDIPTVQEIDRLSFPTPTRSGLFEHELAQNNIAHYQVLGTRESLIGFAGFWLIADEIHVSTIATHPNWRGQGLGELLLLNLLVESYKLPANMVTLEVRRSNVVAQALYRKYQFEEVGTRSRYYRDTGEDALLMTMPLLDARYRQYLEQRQAGLFQRLVGEA
ncbi:MAG: ribosomal protein S18-alanine N-acetyltransferase [Candidatus Promineifilaceae bacterium]|jgi:ribosomal-protein-alanine N-acetyltransferase|nr:ribosomal protein S18-alanine N-acetyltransferase [Anaerolineaceae bacterium]